MTSEELIRAHHVDQERRGLRPLSIDQRDGKLRAFARFVEPRSLLEATRQDVDEFIDRRNVGAKTR